MHDVDDAVSELRRILTAQRTAPEWRWNSRRRLTAVRTALGAAPVSPVVSGELPTQPRGVHDSFAHGVRERLDALIRGVLDELDASTITREVGAVLRDLEPLAGRGGGIRTRG